MAAELALTPRSLAGLPVKKIQEKSQFLNILIYGDSGVGKTVLAGSADQVPSMRPVLVVDMEAGTESLRYTYPEVDIVRPTNWAQMNEVYEALWSGNHGYKTVVLDSLTEIQKFNMYSILQRLVREVDPERDPDVPGMYEWGKNTEQIRKFVRAFRDLEIHTIFTALMKTDKDPRSGTLIKKPSLSGKLADEVAAFLDIVGHMYVKLVPREDGGTEESKEAKRLLLCQAIEGTIAKDRTASLPLVMEEPSMKKLFDCMYTSKEKV